MLNTEENFVKFKQDVDLLVRIIDGAHMVVHLESPSHGSFWDAVEEIMSTSKKLSDECNMARYG
jgi:hypothetical protein